MQLAQMKNDLTFYSYFDKIRVTVECTLYMLRIGYIFNEMKEAKIKRWLFMGFGFVSAAWL